VTGGKRRIIKGHPVNVEGRAAAVQLQGPFRGGKVHSVVTIGKEEPTNAEKQREKIILNALQGTNLILNYPFVQSIWLPSESPDWTKTPHPARVHIHTYPDTIPLNPSQRMAVQAITSCADSERLMLIHGPPGTGKTSVIACATHCIIRSAPCSRTLWLIAQSNVAVKNIAEKLAKTDFLDFKLLVSREFHFDWYVHKVYCRRF